MTVAEFLAETTVVSTARRSYILAEDSASWASVELELYLVGSNLTAF